jgi:arginase family enzyme
MVRWRDALGASLEGEFRRETDRLAAAGCRVYVTVDADAVRTADVPGVSAPNPDGLPGRDVIRCARQAGRSPHVASLDLVEINPLLDRDGQSARWAALVVWNFLIGLAHRQLRARP